MILPSPEDVIRQELESEDPLFMTTKELVEKYGLPKTVNCLEEASKLIKSGVTQMRFLSVMSSDELSEDGHYHDFAMSGIHIVNVVERYVFEKELPQNLFIEDFDYGAVEGEKRTVMVQFTESFTYKKRIPYIEGMDVAKIIEGLDYENDELADHKFVIDSVTKKDNG